MQGNEAKVWIQNKIIIIIKIKKKEDIFEIVCMEKAALSLNFKAEFKNTKIKKKKKMCLISKRIDATFFVYLNKCGSHSGICKSKIISPRIYRFILEILSDIRLWFEIIKLKIYNFIFI